MLEDLYFYFQHRSELLNGFADPKTVSAFMKKIAAFHYLKLIDYLRAMIAERELFLLQRDGVRGLPADWVEQQWSNLHAIVQRCSEYFLKRRGYTLEFRIPRSRTRYSSGSR